MVIEGRSGSSGEQYRYGFNGQEKVEEITNLSSQYDFGARMYDSRLGSFLSIDPLAANYPFQSPYDFAGNNPIKCIDFKGMGPDDAACISDDVLNNEAQVQINTPSVHNYSWEFSTSEEENVKRSWVFSIGGTFTTTEQRQDRDGQNHETSIWSINNKEDMYSTCITGFSSLTESDHFFQAITPSWVGRYDIGVTMFKEKTKPGPDKFGYEAPSPTFLTFGKSWSTENGKLDLGLNIQGGPGFLLGVPRYDGVFQSNPLGKLYRPVGLVSVLIVKIDFIILNKFVVWGAFTTCGVHTWSIANTPNGNRPSTDYATISVKCGVGLPIRTKD
jgi:RHS repeat-associated protein